MVYDGGSHEKRNAQDDGLYRIVCVEPTKKVYPFPKNQTKYRLIGASETLSSNTAEKLISCTSETV